MIRSKTAKLFEASARAGRGAGRRATPQVEEACADYGRSLGTAFQLIDDVLDYTGDADEIGKNVGDDLREGKPTLPLIYRDASAARRSSATLIRACDRDTATSTHFDDDRGDRRAHRRARRTRAKRAAAEATARDAAAIAACRESHAQRALLQLCASLVGSSH